MILSIILINRWLLVVTRGYSYENTVGHTHTNGYSYVNVDQDVLIHLWQFKTSKSDQIYSGEPQRQPFACVHSVR